MDTLPLACPQCHQPIQSEWYFCANCGKDLKAKPRSTTVLTQVGIYALSVFLPPLGYWPGAKYWRDPDPAAKRIGMIAVALTTVSTILTIWLTIAFLQSYVSQISQSMNGLGY